MNKTKASQIANKGRLQLTRALKQLREQARELGDYSPHRPTIQLLDGSYLELTLEKEAEGGGELLGRWHIIRRWADGRRVIYSVAEKTEA